MRKYLTFLGFALVLAPLPAAASGPAFDLSPDGPVPAPAAVGGFNVSNAMPLLKIKAPVALVHPPTFTWPSGNTGDEFPMDRQTLDMLRLQQKFLPADAVWFEQFNLFQGTVDQALAQVATSRDLGIRTDVWTIGNEPDLYGPNRGDRSWTPEKYATVFRQWATALKAAYPGIRVSGPALSNPKDDWMRVFLREDGDLVDVVSWHWYPTDGKKSDDEADLTSDQAGAMVNKYQAWLTDPATNPKGYQRKIATALTEFAIHWDTPNESQIADMVGACWTADVLGRLAEAGLDYSHYFCLQTYGGHAVFGPGNKPRAAWAVFDFYKTLGSAPRMVRVSGNTPGGPVTVHGWVGGDGTWTLVVTNRTGAPVDGVSLGLDGPSPRTLASARVLTDTKAETLAPDRIRQPGEGRGWTLDLPARSVACLVFGP